MLCVLLRRLHVVALQVNTDRTLYKSVGMKHMEGGWPENVDGAEADQVDRYLKKALKVGVRALSCAFASHVWWAFPANL